MKKQFLTVAVAALALAGCSKSETVEVASNRAIGFENFVGKATRAFEATNETIKAGFGVFGDSEAKEVSLFNDVTVKYDGNKWGYEDTKYWMPGRTYRFAAYAPQDKAIKPKFDYTNNKLTFEITCNASNQNDLVYGVATEVAVPAEGAGFETWSPTGPVAFTMGHILSKLEFKVKAGDIESDATLKITDVKIAGNMNTTGTYDATWTPATPTDVSFDGASNEEGIAAAATHSLGVYYVIPQTLTGNVTVSFTVTLFAGDTQIGNPTPLTATIATPTWAQDYVYTYTATVNQENIEGGKPIEFTGSVADWTAGQTGGGDITINQ